MSNEPGDREQLRYIGENTAIRFYDPKDPDDLKRMEETIADKAVINFVEGIKDMDAKDINRWLTRYHDKRRTKNWEVCYMVSGSNAVKPDEVGEVQGFINFYPDEESRDLLPEKYRDSENVVGIGYGRYLKSRPGQISGAIRQACFEVNKMKGMLNGKDIPDMVIIALISQTNNASVKTIEDACFDNQGTVVVDGEKDHLYVLNWEKLNSKLHSQADKILVN
jgi:hypothetical protein